jgi:flagella synthesis protein FlgN
MSVTPGSTQLAASATPADTLSQEQQAAKVLVDCLQQEQALLIAADIEGLSLLTEKKASVVFQMSELATTRHRALAAIGHPASETGMQSWLAERDAKFPAAKKQNKDILNAWSNLLATARQAKEINRVNGILINTHVARNQTALNVLQVQTTDTNLYGPNGQATSAGKGRGLVVG